MIALKRLGAYVITPKDEPEIHVSGHAYGGELQELIQRLQPKYYLPVHGAYTQMLANQQKSAASGLSARRSFVIESGDIIDVSKRDGVQTKGHLDVEVEYVDAGSRTLMPYEVLRERLRIGELGLGLVKGVYDLRQGKWLSKPDILLQGLHFPGNYERWSNDAKTRLRKKIASLIRQGVDDPRELNEEARIALRRYLASSFRKKPVVIACLEFI